MQSELRLASFVLTQPLLETQDMMRVQVSPILLQAVRRGVRQLSRLENKYSARCMPSRKVLFGSVYVVFIVRLTYVHIDICVSLRARTERDFPETSQGKGSSRTHEHLPSRHARHPIPFQHAFSADPSPPYKRNPHVRVGINALNACRTVRWTIPRPRLHHRPSPKCKRLAQRRLASLAGSIRRRGPWSCALRMT